MSRDGYLPQNFPSSYSGYLLVFNEPNVPEPYGCGISPSVAAARYLGLLQRVPDASLVVGGLNIWGVDWFRQFLAACMALGAKWPVYFHAHGYMEQGITASEVILRFHQLHAMGGGGNWWITEHGAPGGTLDDFKTIVGELERTWWIQRHAAFTDRAQGTEPWFPASWPVSNVNLMDYATGALTQRGTYYKSI
jgi:hypothetical protein